MIEKKFSKQLVFYNHSQILTMTFESTRFELVTPNIRPLDICIRLSGFVSFRIFSIRYPTKKQFNIFNEL